MTLSQLSTGWDQPIFASEILVDRKSSFLAHATAVSAKAPFTQFLDHLNSLPRLKNATHCMYAYRMRCDEPSRLVLGQHDGGEGGSGDRLARLLEFSGCDNVAVVVSRWYGGVKLGSDRWKRISSVAKEALHRGAFIKRNEAPLAPIKKIGGRGNKK